MAITPYTLFTQRQIDTPYKQSQVKAIVSKTIYSGKRDGQLNVTQGHTDKKNSHIRFASFRGNDPTETQSTRIYIIIK